MNKAIFFIAIYITCFPCLAEDAFCETVMLQINGASRHYGTTSELNEDNRGLGLSCNYARGRMLATGYFKNSFFRDSFYAAWSAYSPFGGDLHVDPGVVVGAASGYGEYRTETHIHRLSSVFGYFAISVGYRDEARITIGYFPSRIFVRDGIDVLMITSQIKMF